MSPGLTDSLIAMASIISAQIKLRVGIKIFGSWLPIISIILTLKNQAPFMAALDLLICKALALNKQLTVLATAVIQAKFLPQKTCLVFSLTNFNVSSAILLALSAPFRNTCKT